MPRFATYATCNDVPPGSSRSIERFHWCTVACCRFGSTTVMDGAVAEVAANGGDRKLEGFTVGGGSSVGKPCDNRVFVGTDAQPCVVAAAPYAVATHWKATPGIEFAAFAPKNVDTESN